MMKYLMLLITMSVVMIAMDDGQKHEENYGTFAALIPTLKSTSALAKVVNPEGKVFDLITQRDDVGNPHPVFPPEALDGKGKLKKGWSVKNIAVQKQ